METASPRTHKPKIVNGSLKLHTKLWPKLGYAAPVWSLYSKLQINQIEKVQRIAAAPQGYGETRVVSAKWLMSLNGHLLRPIGISPTYFSFTKFIVEESIEKDKYMTLAHSTIMSSQCAQYCRYQPYSIALKNPPQLFHTEIVCLHLFVKKKQLKVVGLFVFLKILKIGTPWVHKEAPRWFCSFEWITFTCVLE